MREESHLDDMRAAIRGDFERLEERRGEQELMRLAEEDPEAHEQPEPDREPEPEREPEPDFEQDASATEREPRGEAADSPAAPATEPELSGEAAQVEQPRSEDAQPEPRSWLDRLLGR